MESRIHEEKMTKYRSPACIEYIEQASYLQYVFIHCCLKIFGPNITRSIAERLHLAKSNNPHDKIIQPIPRIKSTRLFTPTRISLAIDSDHQVTIYSIPYIVKYLHSDEEINIKEILEDIRIHFLNGNIKIFFTLDKEAELTFEHAFNDIYMTHSLGNTSNENIKSRCKDLFANYALSSHPNLMIHHCENSAFVPYLK